LFLQSVLGSLAMVGWTYRLMQRTALKAWLNQPLIQLPWQRSP